MKCGRVIKADGREVNGVESQGDGDGRGGEVEILSIKGITTRNQELQSRETITKADHP